MQVRKNMMLDVDVVERIQQLAEQDNTTFTAVVHEALRLLVDFRAMKNATIIPQEIQKTLDARCAMLETRINAKTNKVLSEVAIQSAIMVQLLANNVELPQGSLDSYRQLAVEMLRANNRVLRLDEVVEDA